jgi:hypothetical protein
VLLSKGSFFLAILFIQPRSLLFSLLPSLPPSGGHFVPAVGHKIFQANKENKGLGNLKGLGIGNGLTGE